jgi:hypothetical protein
MEKKYIYIKNFLNLDELEIANNYSILKHKNNITEFDLLQTELGESAFYSDTLMEYFLEKKIDLIEKHLHKKILPTVSFLRFYNKFSSLKKHVDRNACEITVSCTLGADQDWPLIIEGEKIIIKPGDAVLYYGAKKTHWREEYLGDYQSQVFFHYVEKEGKFKEEKFDKRDSIGLPPQKYV